jgi:hypothetical protein
VSRFLRRGCNAGFKHGFPPKSQVRLLVVERQPLIERPQSHPRYPQTGVVRHQLTRTRRRLAARLGLTSPAVANHNGVVMTTEPRPEEDESPLGTAKEGARGHGARLLAWVVGCLLAVIGAVTAIWDALHHHLSAGPYLLAAGFLLFFLAALDMWRVGRRRARRATRTIRQLAAQAERLEDNRQHLEHDRDQWRRMQAEEASINRRLAEEMERVQRPHISAGEAGVASTSPPTPPVGVGGAHSAPPSSSRVQRSRPRHQARRPADNQPRLFDQDDEGRL